MLLWDSWTGKDSKNYDMWHQGWRMLSHSIGNGVRLRPARLTRMVADHIGVLCWVDIPNIPKAYIQYNHFKTRWRGTVLCKFLVVVAFGLEKNWVLQSNVLVTGDPLGWNKMGRTYHSSVIKDSKIRPEVLPSVVSKQCAEHVTGVTWDVAWLSKTPKYKSHENFWKFMDIFNQMGYFLNLKRPQVVGNPSMLGSRSDTVEAADLRPRALYVELLHTLVKLSRPGG